MRSFFIAAVLVASPACSLFENTERSQVTQLPDAGADNDACHSGGNPSPDGGCCGQTLDAGPENWPDGGPQSWPDGGPQDGGGYLPDGGGGSLDAGGALPDGGY